MFDLLQHAIITGEKLGARFVEARFDDFYIREIKAEMEKIDDVKAIRRVGLGVHVYQNGATGYSFTTGLLKKDVEDATKRSFKIAKSSSEIAKIKVDPGQGESAKHKELKLDVKKHPKDFSTEFKKDLVLRTVKASQGSGKKISSITGRYGELYGHKDFTNSEGTEISWSPILMDLRIHVMSKKGDLLVDGSDSRGGSFGFDFLENEEHSPEKIGGNAGEWAAEKLKAKPAPPGKHRALCENRLVGVLAHESFGHLTESDFVMTGMSP